MYELTVKQRLTNYCYFCIVNCIIAVFISITYCIEINSSLHLSTIELTDWLAIMYIISKHLLILILITSIAGLIVLPSIYLSGKKRIIIQTFFSLVFLGILYFDTRLFKRAFLHIIDINTITYTNTLINVNLMFTPNKIIAFVCSLVLLLLMYKINIWINRTFWFKNNYIAIRSIILIIVLTIASNIIYFTASKERKEQLVSCTQYLPLCANNIITNKVNNTYKSIKSVKLQYPLQQLQLVKVINPPNILIIAMDAWRADCFNEKCSPKLWGFSQYGRVFINHKSGANHTYSGLFSLFYGIPASYYHLFQKQEQPSILFNRLKQLKYQLGFFSDNDNNEILQIIIGKDNSTIINNPDVNKVNNACDEQLTNNWIEWYSELDKTKPWFSFVFYDSLHGLYLPEDYSNSYQQAIEVLEYKDFAEKVGKDVFISRYTTSVHYIDSLANKILIHLKKSNDLANTIVIITSDHGCEWNDNNQGQWGYWSNFTDCQIKIPLAIILPKKWQHQLINQQDKLTTHYDIVPTLIHNFLGVTNNIIDYSIGNNLLDNELKSQKNWMLASSQIPYDSYIMGVIEKDNMLKIYPSGSQHLTDSFNKLIFNSNINTNYLDQALEYMTRFITK